MSNAASTITNWLFNVSASLLCCALFFYFIDLISLLLFTVRGCDAHTAFPRANCHRNVCVLRSNQVRFLFLFLPPCLAIASLAHLICPKTLASASSRSFTSSIPRLLAGLSKKSMSSLRAVTSRRNPTSTSPRSYLPSLPRKSLPSGRGEYIYVSTPTFPSD